MEIAFIVVIVGIAIGAAIFGALAAKRRREEMLSLAGRLGLSFNPDKDRALADRFQFLDALAKGSNRYAFNLLAGMYQGHEVLVFDYHYETHSHGSKGQRRTHHHYFSFFVLLLPRSFPELRITPESLFSKIAQAFGYDDIDFESAEFSRAFCVRSPDKRFAYDVCHARMMEYLLSNRDLLMEIERNALAMGFGKRLEPAQIEANLHRLLMLRSHLPEYLFTKVQHG